MCVCVCAFHYLVAAPDTIVVDMFVLYMLLTVSFVGQNVCIYMILHRLWLMLVEVCG